MLKVESLSAGYGDIAVLHDVSMSVDSKEVVALLGANGAGKTTLLKAIAGILSERRGYVEFNKQPIHGLSAERIVETGLVMVPEGRGLFPFMTVQENLDLGAYSRRARSRWRESLDRVFAFLPRLKERRHQLSGSLSGGEQQMCAIGRGLMAWPEVLMLDEPSLGLAPVIVHEVFGLISALRDEGIAVLLVEQHVKNALAVSHRGYVLENGRIVMSGSGTDLLANPELKRAYMGHKTKEI